LALSVRALDYNTPAAKSSKRRVWRYTRIVPIIALIHFGVFIVVMFSVVSRMGPHGSNRSAGFAVALLAFPMWYVFNSVPTPIGLFGNGLFWGLVVVGAWHLFSVILRAVGRGMER